MSRLESIECRRSQHCRDDQSRERGPPSTESARVQSWCAYDQAHSWSGEPAILFYVFKLIRRQTKSVTQLCSPEDPSKVEIKLNDDHDIDPYW